MECPLPLLSPPCPVELGSMEGVGIDERSVFGVWRAAAGVSLAGSVVGC